MKNILFISLAIVLISGCNKTSTQSTPPVTMQSLAGDYKVTAVTVSGISILDAYLPACQIDDIYTLNTNGAYTINDAGVRCDPPSTTGGSWSLSGNDITIGTQVYTLVKFDGAKIEATTAVDQGGFSVIADVIFTKQ